MKILKYSETDQSKLLMRELDEANVTDTVRAIIEDVAKNGDAALFAYSKKFDRAELSANARRLQQLEQKNLEEARRLMGETT